MVGWSCSCIVITFRLDSQMVACLCATHRYGLMAAVTAFCLSGCQHYFVQWDPYVKCKEPLWEGFKP